MTVPNITDAQAYLGDTSWTTEQITAAYLSEKAAQASVCKVPASLPGSPLDQMTIAEPNTSEDNSLTYYGANAYVEFRTVTCHETGTVTIPARTVTGAQDNNRAQFTVWEQGDEGPLTPDTPDYGGTPVVDSYGGTTIPVVAGTTYTLALEMYQVQPEDIGATVDYGPLLEAIHLPGSQIVAVPWPEDLIEALYRRVAHNLAMRNLPLGLQTSLSEVTISTTRVGGTDAEVRRLEAPYRKRIVG